MIIIEFIPRLIFLIPLLILRSLKMVVEDDPVLQVLAPFILLLTPAIAILFICLTPAKERGWMGAIEVKSG